VQVYFITHKDSGKTYVGKTVSENLHHYLSTKRWQVRYNKVMGMPIISAILKYGWSAFDIQTVAVCKTEEELNNLERLWIAVLNSTHTGYNICLGGGAPTAGRHLSQETKDRIGAANRGRKPVGYVRTEEHRQQLRERQRGNKVAVGHGRPKGAHSSEEIAKRSIGIQAAWDRRRNVTPR
jgi:group I intron endonuclease